MVAETTVHFLAPQVARRELAASLLQIWMANNNYLGDKPLGKPGRNFLCWLIGVGRATLIVYHPMGRTHRWNTEEEVS